MLKRSLFLFTVVCLFGMNSFAQWKPAGGKIKTFWAEKIDPDNVLPEYPRPIMERAKWKNLNGLWKYAISSRKNTEPFDYEGDILDLHNYPQPRLYFYDAMRATVLGEYGGIGLALEGRLWGPESNFCTYNGPNANLHGGRRG